MNETVHALLFPEDGKNTYAVVDGASCEELLEKLEEWRPESVCLYAGELAPDVEAAAPHLVSLPREHPFTKWYLANDLGKHWGIFAVSPADMLALRKHFRTILTVKSPQGKTLYFRYYDPRVLSVYLPLVNADERQTVFGDVQTFFCETKDGGLLAFRRDAEFPAGELVARTLDAAGGPGRQP